MPIVELCKFARFLVAVKHLLTQLHTCMDTNAVRVQTHVSADSIHISASTNVITSIECAVCI